MSIELLIIADDLTGAVDAAVQFSKQGIAAAVSLGPDFDYSRISGSLQVVAINTESRHAPRHVAYERVAKAVAKAKILGVPRYYKKIDSTFRGNVGAEVEALLQAAQCHQLMLVPAYPKAGRTLRDGVAYVNGSPLQSSPYAADVLDPVHESSVRAILNSQTDYPVHSIIVASLAMLDIAEERRGGIFLFDAETDGDLQAIGEALKRGGKIWCCAGSAGFAELLPGLYGYTAGEERRALSAARLLVVNGSQNETSLAQVQHASAAGVPCFTIAPGGPAAETAEGLRTVGSIVQQLNNIGWALLTPPPMAAGAGSATAAFALGRYAAAVLASAGDTGVAVFGGDTAAAVCSAAGCRVLYPKSEIVPGCALCSDSVSVGGRAWALKSGGFGPPDIVGRIRKSLSG